MQQRVTRKNDMPTPATPTIHGNRRNKITPNMFWTVGRYTPIMVPRLACTDTYQIATAHRRSLALTPFTQKP